jgi:hypothetical protein
MELVGWEETGAINLLTAHSMEMVDTTITNRTMAVQLLLTNHRSPTKPQARPSTATMAIMDKMRTSCNNRRVPTNLNGAGIQCTMHLKDPHRRREVLSFAERLPSLGKVTRKGDNRSRQGTKGGVMIRGYQFARLSLGRSERYLREARTVFSTK